MSEDQGFMTFDEAPDVERELSALVTSMLNAGRQVGNAREAVADLHHLNQVAAGRRELRAGEQRLAPEQAGHIWKESGLYTPRVQEAVRRVAEQPSFVREHGDLADQYGRADDGGLEPAVFTRATANTLHDSDRVVDRDKERGDPTGDAGLSLPTEVQPGLAPDIEARLRGEEPAARYERQTPSALDRPINTPDGPADQARPPEDTQSLNRPINPGQDERAEQPGSPGEPVLNRPIDDPPQADRGSQRPDERPDIAGAADQLAHGVSADGARPAAPSADSRQGSGEQQTPQDIIEQLRNGVRPDAPGETEGRPAAGGQGNVRRISGQLPMPGSTGRGGQEQASEGGPRGGSDRGLGHQQGEGNASHRTNAARQHPKDWEPGKGQGSDGREHNR